jgi:hypothetical protein
MNLSLANEGMFVAPKRQEICKVKASKCDLSLHVRKSHRPALVAVTCFVGIQAGWRIDRHGCLLPDRKLETQG